MAIDDKAGRAIKYRTPTVRQAVIDFGKLPTFILLIIKADANYSQLAVPCVFHSRTKTSITVRRAVPLSGDGGGPGELVTFPVEEIEEFVALHAANAFKRHFSIHPVSPGGFVKA